APLSIAVGGTSGKSTTTGMLGWILAQAGRDPTIMNGAVMKNFATPEIPFASAAVGRGDVFVSEVDESDGSTALFPPRIAVLTTGAHGHKSMEELRALFGTFVARAAAAGGRAVLNLDNAETRALADALAPGARTTYSLADPGADLFAREIAPSPAGVA